MMHDDCQEAAEGDRGKDTFSAADSTSSSTRANDNCDYEVDDDEVDFSSRSMRLAEEEEDSTSVPTSVEEDEEENKFSMAAVLVEESNPKVFDDEMIVTAVEVNDHEMLATAAGVVQLSTEQQPAPIEVAPKNSYNTPYAGSTTILTGKRKRTKPKIYAEEQMEELLHLHQQQQHHSPHRTTAPSSSRREAGSTGSKRAMGCNVSSTSFSKVKLQQQTHKQNKQHRQYSNKKQEQANLRRKWNAAQEAREYLQRAIQTLPKQVQGILVHNLGIVHVPSPDSSILLTDSANKIYPIGFSATWSVSSPFHNNRIIQCRCDIISHPQQLGKPYFRIQCPNVASASDVEAVDQVYKPFSIDNATPVLLPSEEIIPKQSQKSQDADTSFGGLAVTPHVLMSVQVRFDEADWYKGTILDVIPHQTNNSTGTFTTTSNYYTLQIEYEDGSVESEVYPAEGIILMPQQQPAQQKYHITYGNTPLEAWGNLLITFGLIDEVTYEKAHLNVCLQRQKRFTEAEDRLKQLQQQRRQAKLRHKQKKMGIPQEEEERAPTVKLAAVSEKQTTMTATAQCDEDEETLIAKFEALNGLYCQFLDTSQKLQQQISQARWASLGEDTYSHHHHSILHATTKQQQLWLTSVFRREKSKIGSTGNKRKIFNSADLLHRMDTFFNPEIEKLIEGLPGSELCPNYIFISLRGTVIAGITSTNASAVVATGSVLPVTISSKSSLIPQEPVPTQEQTKKTEKSQEDHLCKSTLGKNHQKMMKLSQEETAKQLKRRAREEVQEQRKQQKLEEEQEKKKARQEERLARLAVQVEDRLFKEACFQREKVIAAAQRAAVKENSRRKNAAEKVASFMVEQRQGIEKEGDEVSLGTYSQIKEVFSQSLPKFSQLQFHRDVLRLWDFIHTFQAAFMETNTAAADVDGPSADLLSLEEIQHAVDSLRLEEDFEFEDDDDSALSTKEYELLLRKRQEGVKLLTKIAVFLSKPLAKSVAKTLSSVTTPSSNHNSSSVLAPFATNSMEDVVAVEEVNSLSAQFELPVTEITWREIARLSILTDALTELMFSKVDCANILRGYRIGGHPNSKEAQRLRRGEDAAIGRLRQILRERPSKLFPGVDMNASGQVNACVKVTLQLPSYPSALATSDWTFFVHNMLALPGDSSGSVDVIKENLIKAWDLFQASSNAATPKSVELTGTAREEIANEFRRSIVMLEHAGEHYSDVSNKAQKVALKILERATGEIYSAGKVGQLFYRDVAERHLRAQREVGTKRPGKPLVRKAARLRMGMVESLMVSSLAYKKAVTEREEYMATALKIQLKREHLAGRSREEERCDVDEDDEEISDDEDDEEVKTETGSQLGDETESGGKGKVLDVVEIDLKRVGKPTPYDEFCGDDSSFPEYIRRCLAVLRTLCMSPPGETFIYPVDPQANPRYYETVSRPMCLQDIGKFLRKSGKRLATSSDMHAGPDVDDVVAEFARNVRLISDNCVCYSAIGAALVSHAEQLLRIFERLLLDWVLSPAPILPPLEALDDDRCVNHHSSDKDSLILICDGCEGKYNMSRLQPKMFDVPKGDWFCKNCINGLCWASLDQRVGCIVYKKTRGSKDALRATIKSVMSIFPEYSEGKSTLGYVVEYDVDGIQEVWTLEEVNEALKSNSFDVPPIKCVEAVAESPGYGAGREFGIGEIVPVFLNPNVSDAAAQALTTSTVFKNSVKGAALLSLCSHPDELTAEEWLHILLLLAMNCVLTDEVQEVGIKLENEAAEKMSSFFGTSNRVNTVEEILPEISADDESVEGNREFCRVYPKGESNEFLVNSLSSMNTKRKVVLFGDEDSTEEEDGNDVTEPELELQNGEFHFGSRKKASYQQTAVSQIVTDSLSTEDKTCETAIAKYNAVGKVCESELIYSPDEAISDFSICKKMRSSALSMASGRSKAREDSFIGISIKAQLKPVLESFEEDTFSPVVDTLLSSQPDGLKLDSCTCPNVTCDFCGLPDTALGSLLLRVPNRREWTELMSHATRSRISHIIAEIHTAIDGGSSETKRKLLSVVLRIGGKIVSADPDPNAFENLPSHGMLEYLPRNKQGAQDEMLFRYKTLLPHITGSLSAHECCAAAAHNSRKEMLLKSYRERIEAAAERDFGRLCGKTLPVGVDYAGRSYWKFLGEQHSLFICDSATEEFIDPPAWYRYNKPETIASVIVCLGTHDLAEELSRLFPDSSKLIMSGTWRNLLLRRTFPHIETIRETIDEHNTSAERREKDVKLDEVEYEAGDDILVKSKSHNMIWNAVVVAVSKDRTTGAAKSYRVHYKLWSSRFDEWVSADRVITPTDHNLEIQDELLEEWIAKKEGVPEDLGFLIAKNYLLSKRRARKLDLSLNHFDFITVGFGVSSERKTVANLKFSLITIEAALPQGSVDTSSTGSWNPSSSSYWRLMVENCPGLASLMGCVLLLEDAINKAWLRPQMKHLLDCLPKCWKAISDASVPSIATRIWVLDRAIVYDVASGSRSSNSAGNIGKTRKSR